MPAGEVPREVPRCRDLVGEHPESVDVALSAALRDTATGLQRTVKRSEQRVVIGNPMKRRVREDRVDLLRKRELDQVLAEDDGTIAERSLSVLGHRRRRVDAVHPTTRDAGLPRAP